MPAEASAVRRLCVEVLKNFITAASSKEGEFVTSTTTEAPFKASARPSPVTTSTPERRDAATTSWPSPVSIVTSLDPMSPLPPTTTIFILHLHVRSGVLAEVAGHGLRGRHARLMRTD